MTFKGDLVNDDVKFVFNDGQHIEFKTNFMLINRPSQPFTSKYDGFIGLAPWTNDDGLIDKENSFLWQLKKNGVIDHLSFSVYTREAARDNVSVVKFGGYDKQGLAANEHLTLLRTEDAS